jgi:hypothetical protein
MPSSCGMTMSMRITSGTSSALRSIALDAVLGLADHLDVVEQLEVAAQTAADDPVVVDEQDPDAFRRSRRPRRRLDRPCSSSPSLPPGVGVHRRGSRSAVLGPTGPPPVPSSPRPGTPLEQDRCREDRDTARHLDRGQRLVQEERGQRHPTSGSNSIRIPARVPPIARMPVRKRIDGMPAAKTR